jgi:hypothetical protein
MTKPIISTRLMSMRLAREKRAFLNHRAYEWIIRCAHILWLFTKDDFFTSVGPNTTFGIFAALSGSIIFDRPHTPLQLIFRLHRVVLFNWTKLIIFDLANQRLPSSAQEDLLNKPWRPVPSGRMTCDHVRQAMLPAIPAVLLFNYYALGVGSECAVLIILTWLYNDLGGGDRNWLTRNAIIAVAFWFYNIDPPRLRPEIPPCYPQISWLSA